jgi:hypothetical protein
MTLYRVLRSLQISDSKIIPAGDFVMSGEYKPGVLDKLEEVGALGVLHAPPLSELPDFDAAEQLAAVGIVNADQLLERPSDEIANLLSVDKTEVFQWKTDVSNWLIIPVRAGG